MEALLIEATEFTPKVSLDPVTHRFGISGDSRPENAGKFYQPLLAWLAQYESVLYFQKTNYNQQQKVIFEFRLEYFNSISAKYIMEILSLLDKFFKGGYDIQVKWCYDSMDNDMKESGEDFAKLLTVPFEFSVNS